jgi:ribose transport system ATP-binding protein
VAEYSIKTPSPDAVFASLSGGNQQKVVLARWLRRNPRVLLLDEPTQGVDIMSRRDIYASIRKAAEGGCAVLVASSDFVELCELCDRVVVLQKGRVVTSVEGAAMAVDHLTALTQSSALAEGSSR